MIAEHLSSWAEEWILWNTQEFGFWRCLMRFAPAAASCRKKKTPTFWSFDPRSRSPRVIGRTTTLLVLVKGLPLAYNRDLQEDKEPVFDAFDTVEACLELAAVVVEGASLRIERIAGRLDAGFLDATTLMNP